MKIKYALRSCVIATLLLLFISSCRRNDDMFMAIGNNDVSMVGAVIAKDSKSVNRPDSRKEMRGMMPLHYAAWKGNVEIVKLLLDHGADLHATIVEQSVIHFAARSGNVEVISILLDKGADVNAKGFMEATPLMYAAARSDLIMARFLLERGADIQQKDIQGFTALYNAVENGSPEIIDFLISRGANVNEISKTSYGYETPLYHAMLRGRIDNAILLVTKYNANVNTQTADSSTPLHLAVYKGQKEMVDVLLKNKGNPLAKDAKGLTPIELLSESTPNREEIQQLFALYSPDSLNAKLASDNKIQDAKLRDKLFKDMDSLNITEVRTVIENGLNIEEKNQLLYNSFVSKRYDIAELLLENGASPNIDELGTPLIIVATSEERYDFVKLLLKYNVNLNVVDEDGFTPLHMAVYLDYTRLETLLRQNGADPNIKDKLGYTPNDYVKMIHNGKNIEKPLK